MLDFIDLTSIPIFLLVLVRVTGFMVTLPLFTYRTIPNEFKIGFAFFLALVMFYTVDATLTTIDGNYILLIIKEAIVGLSIGFIAYVVISSIQIAGGFIDFQMGFAIANVIDPQTGAQSPLIGQYLYIISLLFLLSVNGHHLLIDGVFYSYDLIPIDEVIPIANNTGIIAFIVEVFNKMFVIAFQMAVPIVGSLFLVDVALGIVARSVPQLNVFVVGLPIKIFVSFVIILLFLGLYIGLIRILFENMFETMRALMQLFGGA